MPRPLSHPLTLSRRGLLAAGLAPLVAAPQRPAVGIQFYTLRNSLTQKPEETLEAVARLGVRNAEVLRSHLGTLAPTMKRLGIQPVSVHLETPLLTGDWSAWSSVANRETLTLGPALAEARKHGLQYAVCPYLMPKERGGADVYRRLADHLNRAGEACRAAGLKLAYHNHAFEFATVENTRPLDILLSRTDPKLVGLELDVFWVSVAGLDPVEVIRQHAGRVPLLHLKDKARDTPQRFTEDVARSAFKELGTGALDFPAILKAAAESQVAYAFVEQDQTPGEPIESVRQSWEYLKRLKAV